MADTGKNGVVKTLGVIIAIVIALLGVYISQSNDLQQYQIDTINAHLASIEKRMCIDDKIEYEDVQRLSTIEAEIVRLEKEILYLRGKQ